MIWHAKEQCELRQNNLNGLEINTNMKMLNEAEFYSLKT